MIEVGLIEGPASTPVLHIVSRRKRSCSRASLRGRRRERLQCQTKKVQQSDYELKMGALCIRAYVLVVEFKARA